MKLAGYTYSCNSLTNIEYETLTNTGNGNYGNLLKLPWKNSWNHIKLTYFWPVLAIWNHCGASEALEFGISLPFFVTALGDCSSVETLMNYNISIETPKYCRYFVLQFCHFANWCLLDFYRLPCCCKLMQQALNFLNSLWLFNILIE